MMFTKDNNEIQNKINSAFWDPYHSQTIILSSVCRQLAYAEGGICWIFIKQGCAQHPEIYLILKSIVFFFVFDFFQYLVAIIIYYCVGKCYERHIKSLRKQMILLDRPG